MDSANDIAKPAPGLGRAKRGWMAAVPRRFDHWLDWLWFGGAAAVAVAATVEFGIGLAPFFMAGWFALFMSVLRKPLRALQLPKPDLDRAREAGEARAARMLKAQKKAEEEGFISKHPILFFLLVVFMLKGFLVYAVSPAIVEAITLNEFQRTQAVICFALAMLCITYHLRNHRALFALAAYYPQGGVHRLVCAVVWLLLLWVGIAADLGYPEIFSGATQYANGVFWSSLTIVLVFMLVSVTSHININIYIHSRRKS